MKENLQSNTDKHTRITVEYLKEGFENTNFTAKVVQPNLTEILSIDIEGFQLVGYIRPNPEDRLNKNWDRICMTIRPTQGTESSSIYVHFGLPRFGLSGLKSVTSF